jgi:hypothetical protein
MSDPRNTIAFDEVDAHYSTYKIDNSTITYDGTKARGAATTMLDKAVTLSAAGTVALAADGDKVIGRLDGVESDDKARVQDEGYMTLPGGNGASLTLGKSIVGALNASSAKGYIREAASGTAAELVKQSGEIIDAGTTTAVVVKF